MATIRAVAEPRSRWGRIMLLSIGVGVVAGLAATLLEFALSLALPRLVERFTGIGGAQVFRFHWGILLLPVLGGAVSSALTTLLARGKGTHGTEAMVRAFHHEQGRLSLRETAVKATAAVGVIGCGGSAGPEGPIAGLGAAIGSTLSDAFGMTPRERRLFLLAGCAGGVGAIFQCPLGGALFAATILYREPDIEADALMPCIVSSVISYSTFMAFWGYGHPLLRGTSSLAFARPAELLAYALLGFLCAAAAFVFYACHRSVLRIRAASGAPGWMTPPLGGLLVGLVALALPQVMDPRYRFLQNLVDGGRFLEQQTWIAWLSLLALIVLAKCLATALTVGSGNAGGLLGPTVFIGGAVGGVTGAILETVAPGYFPEPLRQSLIPVGMAGMLAASMRTPLAAIVMVTEMTWSYGLIVPLMFVSVLSYVLGRRWGLNPEQLRNPSDSPAHAGDAVVTILESLRAGELAERAWPHRVSPRATLAEIVARIPEGTRPTFAVLQEGRFLGTIAPEDIAAAVGEHVPGLAIIAADLTRADAQVAQAGDTLYETLDTFHRHHLETLPVVEGEDRRFVGMLSRHAVTKALRSRLSAQGAHVLREHEGLAAVVQEQQFEGLLSELPAHRKGTIRRMEVPEDVVGKSLREADFRRRYGGQVIAIQTAAGELLSPPDPGRPLGLEDFLVVLHTEPTSGASPLSGPSTENHPRRPIS